MRVKSKWDAAGFFSYGGHLVLLLLGLQINTRGVWMLVSAFIALSSLLVWPSVLRRLRLLRDTPTSRIASAAQGYVEIIGQGKPLGEPLRSRLTLLPCLWYSYRVYRKKGDDWVLDEKGESEEPFLLDDGSGQCVVDPSGAEVLTRREDSWVKGEYRYVESLLLTSDTLYVLGQFRTYGGGSVYLNLEEETKSVLAEWKQDRKTLHERFDLNGDGEIDMNEWMLARQAARREAEQRINDVRAEPDTHYLTQPGDKRPFIISSQPQDRLVLIYHALSVAHPVIFIVFLSVLAWMLAE